MVDREVAALLTAVLAGPTIAGEDRAARDLPAVCVTGDAHVGDEADDHRPRHRDALRVEVPLGLLEDLRPLLEHEHRRAPDPASGSAWKTALLFWEPDDDRPGWLVRCLAEFADRDVNLTRIESRPRREGLGSYMFFVDLDGHAGAPAVAEAIEALRAHAAAVRVLGSFPTGP